MILHCTTKLATKLPRSLWEEAAAAGSSDRLPQFEDWHGHLLVLDRRQCVIFCHDLTRYVLFIPGLRAPQFAELERWHRELFTATLAAQSVSSFDLERLELALGPMRIDRRTDRSVLGSMRVVVDDLQHRLLTRVPHVFDLDPIATSLQLNERPCTVRNSLVWPMQAMQTLVQQQARSATA
ncbi:hypothetical protein YTPLAS18_13500 [Nitrospira sp.]|nr:hypothetical protein YTPLAS18_13500 [Nitrospira sp.]